MSGPDQPRTPPPEQAHGGPSPGQQDSTERLSVVREVTNLGWPYAPYSTAHRPVQHPIRLLTGLAVHPEGWAAVHLPVHRTQVMDVLPGSLGVHAVWSRGPAGWASLDRLLFSGRRQAAAIAGYGVLEPLARAAYRLAAAGIQAPGLGVLLPEWISTPVQTPARASQRRAQLLDLDCIDDLPGWCQDLLTSTLPAPPSPSIGPGTGQHRADPLLAGLALAAPNRTSARVSSGSTPASCPPTPSVTPPPGCAPTRPASPSTLTAGLQAWLPPR